MEGVTQELFRSPELAVRHLAGFASACCVVTFDSFTDNRTLDRPGFGEDFFRSRRIDAVHVISRENDWYQYPEMEQAMAAVHAATRGYGRVVTYGSSMGGYAAIRLAGLAGAHCALAMSPQYSIDPKLAGFERRWREPSVRFKPVWERRLPWPVLHEAYVVYDPEDLDGRHAALLRSKFTFTPVPLPYAGHTVSGYLQEIGLLQSLVLSVCDGTFDPAATIRDAWERREQSPQHFAARAERSRRRSQRIALLAEAVRIAPHHVGCLSRLAMELTRAGRFAEALALHGDAVALHPANPGGLVLYSLTLERSGNLKAALAVMEEVAALTGGASLYAKRLGTLRYRLRDGDGASSLRMSLPKWFRDRRDTRRLAKPDHS